MVSWLKVLTLLWFNKLPPISWAAATARAHTISSPSLQNVQLTPFQEMGAAAHLYQITPWHVWGSRPPFIIPQSRWSVVEDMSIRCAPGVGIHSSPGPVASAGWWTPATASSPWAGVRAALCSVLCLLHSRRKPEHRRESPEMSLPASDMGGKDGAREPAAPKQLPWLSSGYVTSSCVTRTAAAPKKADFFYAKILHFGFRWRTNTVCTSVISYTHPNILLRSICVSELSICIFSFLLCFPDNTTQFSTTAVHMIHKISLFVWVMYLYLLPPGIWWNSFLLLTSAFGLWWLKSLLPWAALDWTRTLVSTGSSYSSI